MGFDIELCLGFSLEEKIQAIFLAWEKCMIFWQALYLVIDF